MVKKLKHQFLDAVIAGKLGKQTDRGVIVTIKEFTAYFIKQNKKEEYLRCYLPSVAIEVGRHMMLHNKYLFRIGIGIYLIHNDAIIRHKNKETSLSKRIIRVE